MKSYVVFLLQIMVWSGYTLAEWLSQHDRIVFKVVMFIVFFNIAVWIAKKIIQTNSQTAFITFVSLSTYTIFHVIMNQWMN
ncbi:hypothetical protein [Peribacillus alkalitolerans]|uniref:hypothetical protein n=1 Tax=Peribacillus alkalitolerans TaxID=1550385 RepID=UPI0013D8A4A4|nr:hypothetical protein [Peribacillus alkalitolerans]